MPLMIWGGSDVGRVHTINDDCVFPTGMWPSPFAIDSPAAEVRGWLMAVADGVSSTRHGAIASATAIQTLVDQFYGASPDHLAVEMTVDARLVTAVGAANAATRAVAESAEDEIAAATTLVAVVIQNNQAWVSHVGDSRAYWVHDGRAEPLTNDHSVVQELLDAGAITYEEALTHPDQGALTRALGVTDLLHVDLCGPITLDLDDRLVLCSDGLTTLVSDDEIARIAVNHEPAEAVRRLLDLANKRGGHDNISVVVAELGKTNTRPRWLRRLGLRFGALRTHGR